MKLILGNCLDAMREMPADSVDSIVTDPPYGISFMGKAWDYDVPAVEIWREALRVLKPGGHLLAFAGTRTQHRMAVNIEDAGFEIRDMIAWVYGSGFPKSLDVGKAIDKKGGNPGLTHAVAAALKAARESRGISKAEADRLFCGGTTLYSWYEGRPAGIELPTSGYMRKIAEAWPEMEKFVGLTQEAEREVIGKKETGDPVAWFAQQNRGNGVVDITAPATSEAQKWDGWGTALKPALEPITVARKPLVGTVAANVLEHGTGAINVDGCRVHAHDSEGKKYTVKRTAPGAVQNATGETKFGDGTMFEGETQPGRWPANLIHDGSPEVVAAFPETKSGAILPHHKSSESENRSMSGKNYARGAQSSPASSGSASRFFYCAKTSKTDRNESKPAMPLFGIEAEHTENRHPTVKPTDLMRYLCRLVTPPGGVVLDPFMGSGSTGKAAKLEGFDFIGCELDADSLEVARARIEGVRCE